MDEAAPAVAKDLKFDVVAVLDVFLDIYTRIAKGLFGFTAGGVVALDKRDVIVCRAHAPPAAAGDGFDHDGVADPFGRGQGVLLVFNRSFRTWRSLDARPFGQGAAQGLVFQGIHRTGTRPNELDIAAFAHVGKVGVFRQKTVAGMDGVHIGNFRGADDAVDAQIAFAAGCLADANGFISHLHMHGIGIDFRIDRHRADIHFLAGTNDADGDFAAIGHQNFFKHG